MYAMYKIEIKSEFSAAHSLKDYQGKCENLHGHNWQIEAEFESSELNSIGLVEDFGVLKKLLREVLFEFDHTHLNELPAFKNINPTSENIARYIFNNLGRKLRAPSYKLTKITVWETETSAASYEGDSYQ